MAWCRRRCSAARVAPDAEGFTPAYAIDTRFGPLVPFQLQVGAPNDLGVRFKVNYETPSDNSYIYEGMTCEPTARAPVERSHVERDPASS